MSTVSTEPLPTAGLATTDSSEYPVRDSDFSEPFFPAWTTTSFDEDFFNGVERNTFGVGSNTFGVGSNTVGVDTPYEMVQTYRYSTEETGFSELYPDIDSHATGVDSTHQREIGQSLTIGTDFGFHLAGSRQPEEYDLEMTPSTNLTPSTYLADLSSQSPLPASAAIPLNAAGNDCTCRACSWTKLPKVSNYSKGLHCVITGCGYFHYWPNYLRKHIKTHYSQSGRFPCDAPDCKTISGRWSDFLRHHKSNHCRRPQTFPCDVLGCKYGGDNGFPRKDKLMSHKRNVHQGFAAPRKQPRAIKPKVQE